MLQTEALKILKLGRNVFLTGPAGSGKTYVLNKYIKHLKKHNICVGITASTGIASTHLGGMTIHSWSGIGIKETLTDKDITDLFRRLYGAQKIGGKAAGIAGGGVAAGAGIYMLNKLLGGR